MRLHWDESRCVGQALCFAKAPQIWDCDDSGYAVLKIDGDIPPELEDLARLSEASCPERAISIVE